MEEVKTTKKRFRPTLTAYREQESQIKTLSELAKELQKKNTAMTYYGEELESQIVELKEKNERLQRQINDDMVPRSAYDELLSKYDTLEKSNKFVEDGHITLRKQLEEEVKAHKACQRELYFLKNRSFWKRVFNINK